MPSTPGAEANTARGPITVWLSNNPDEVAWGEEMVKAWNADHPDEQVKTQEIPAGSSSEEAIYAAITAGTAPCLVLNTAPSAVPQFQRAGGLVSLDVFADGASTIEERSGAAAEQFLSPDGQYYQIPWKSNPVMIVYNKKLFEEAGIDPENPPLTTYAEFLDTSQKIVDAGVAKAAIWPAPTAEFFQSWFDFYPLYAGQADLQLIEDGQATFATDDGEAVAGFWKEMYARGLSPQESYSGDAFADEVSAMAPVGPWALKVYGDKVDFGIVPVPTLTGKPADEVATFSDAKNIGMFTACENRLTAWDFAKSLITEESDARLLEVTGQMPIREDLTSTFPDYFADHPAYLPFAEQTERIIEVPNVPNSTEAWQIFRNMWSQAVIFGEGDLRGQLDDAAAKITELVQKGLERQGLDPSANGGGQG